MNSPEARRKAMRLLRAIHEKTGGRSRGVRDVAELETGLTAEESRGAWRDLLEMGLIERFSLDYAARLSPAGVDFIDSGQLPGPSRKVFIVRGSDTEPGQAVAQFVEEMHCQAVAVDDHAPDGRTIMEQVEAHDDVSCAIVLLTSDDLGGAPGGTTELRPRLSVLMELGYLLGRLGRANVCGIAITTAMELPKDLAGAALASFDSTEGWKSALVRLLS